MKKIKLLTLAVLCGGLLLQACKEDKLDTYSSKDSIVFTNMMYPVASVFTTSYTFEDVTYQQRFLSTKRSVDTLVVSSFVKTPEENAIRVYVPVSVVGVKSPVERQFAVKVNPLTEDGQAYNAIKDLDYKIVSATVPANDQYGAVIVEFYKANMDELYRHKVQMQLELVANANFDVQMQEIKQSTTSSNLSKPATMTVTCAIGLDKPEGWDANLGSASQLGYFSSKKYGVVLSLGYAEGLLQAAPNKLLPASIATSMGATLQRYLDDMEARGETIYEDLLDPSGNKIKMTRNTKMY